MIIPIRYEGDYPLTIHLLITSRCNFNCPECFYKRGDGELPEKTVSTWLYQWKGIVRSLAIGGGEPFLYEPLPRIIAKAKEYGMFVAVTTNGSILPTKKDFPVVPDRIHISYDDVHPLKKKQAIKAIRHFRDMEVKSIGINHIVTNPKDFADAYSLLKEDINKITLLLKKPVAGKGTNKVIDKVLTLIDDNSHAFWFDPCLWKTMNISEKTGVIKQCDQGKISMCIDYKGRASICSNSKDYVEYTNLSDTWAKVKTIVCPLDKKPGLNFKEVKSRKGTMLVVEKTSYLKQEGSI